MTLYGIQRALQKQQVDIFLDSLKAGLSTYFNIL